MGKGRSRTPDESSGAHTVRMAYIHKAEHLEARKTMSSGGRIIWKHAENLMHRLIQW